MLFPCCIYDTTRYAVVALLLICCCCFNSACSFNSSTTHDLLHLSCNSNQPCCVDVSRDGATRSGFVCALSYLVERLKVEQEVDVFQSVKHTRTNRNQIVPTFVSFCHQLHTFHNFCTLALIADNLRHNSSRINLNTNIKYNF